MQPCREPSSSSRTTDHTWDISDAALCFHSLSDCSQHPSTKLSFVCVLCWSSCPCGASSDSSSCSWVHQLICRQQHIAENGCTGTTPRRSQRVTKSPGLGFVSAVTKSSLLLHQVQRQTFCSGSNVWLGLLLSEGFSLQTNRRVPPLGGKGRHCLVEQSSCAVARCRCVV